MWKTHKGSLRDRFPPFGISDMRLYLVSVRSCALVGKTLKDHLRMDTDVSRVETAWSNIERESIFLTLFHFFATGACRFYSIFYFKEVGNRFFSIFLQRERLGYMYLWIFILISFLLFSPGGPRPLSYFRIQNKHPSEWCLANTNGSSWMILGDNTMIRNSEKGMARVSAWTARELWDKGSFKKMPPPPFNIPDNGLYER